MVYQARSAHLNTLRTVLVLFLVGSASAAHAGGLRIRPDDAEAVGSLVLKGESAPLPGGWKVDGVSIEPSRVAIRLAGPEGGTTVWLLAPSDPGEGVALGETRSFRVQRAEGGGEAARAAAEALLERVKGRDEGRFRPQEATSEPGGAGPGADRGSDAVLQPLLGRGVDLGLRLARWAALVAILGLWWRRRRPELDRRTLGVALVLLVGALLLRVTLPAWAPLHANDHGVDELAGLAGYADSDGVVGRSAVQYGHGHRDFVRGVLAVAGHDSDAVLGLGAVLGALLVPLLFVWVRRRWDSLPAALLAALGLIVHPAWVRLSPSESPWMLAWALALLALILGEGARDPKAESDRQPVLLALGAGLALSLALELRVVTLWLGPAVALLWLHPRTWRRLVGPVALAGAFGVLHLVAVWPTFIGTSERTGGLLHYALLGPKNILNDPTLASPVLFGLALLGIGALALTRRYWDAVVMTVAAGGHLVLAQVVNADRTDAIRYQAPAHVLLLVAAAALVLVTRVRTRQALVAYVVGVGLVLGALPGLRALSSRTLEEQAWARLTREPAPKAMHLTLPFERAGRVLYHLPDWRVAEGGVTLGSEAACYVYIGPACWRFARGPELEAELSAAPRPWGEPMRPECVQAADVARAGMMLVPVDPAFPEQGFHEVPARRPRIGYAPCR